MGACVAPAQFASSLEPAGNTVQLLVVTDAGDDVIKPHPPARRHAAMNGSSPAWQPDDDTSSDSDSDSDEQQEPWQLPHDHLDDDVEPAVHDPRDEGTADAWIPRNPSLIRLTGKHPLNCEPPLPRLMRHGFLTPASLHYVRNHGPVPRGDWASWSIEVTGLVRHPARLTMDDLATAFPAAELPVTLVCSSNRRKEQNMARQTLGFNWGPGAVSTSLWRGARLRDVVRRRCGGALPGATHVCFEGADDLPGGGGCQYGTSITLERAMDVILAYMQNGELLLPDHGFPVRVIVPGCTAGRMVKWLRRIVVTAAESDNYYHYRDNRVLPSHVDAELADAQAWWYKPEYVINEMNINSVITTPGHGDVLPINGGISTYAVEGYAYSGGGKKVTRVEVTLDGGNTWLLCDVSHPEKPNKYGRYWCWCFWSVHVDVADLLGSREIAVRAWDQTFNTQPENLTWNLMGMMNNCWFRVKISVRRPQDKGDGIGLVFEHPVQPGNQQGGWMAPPPQKKHLETAAEALATTAQHAKQKLFFTMSEVRQHVSRDSAWIVVHGHVYDCTPYLKDHPGGADSILINAGTDCTDEFDAIHSDKARTLLAAYLIGKLVADDTDEAAPIIHEAAAAAWPVALSDPRQKVPCRLVGKRELSRDARLLRFALPRPDQPLGLPVGKHVLVCADDIDGEPCARAYTPTSAADEAGHFDLLVKVYFKGEHPAFPRGGRMTQYLDSLPLGSVIHVKGPRGRVEYLGRGVFAVDGEARRRVSRLAMVAGGTGITPIYQVIMAALRDQPEDTMEMHLVYANRSEDDILLRGEIDRWAAEYPDRLKVWYVVSQVRRPEEGWQYSVGIVNEDILKEHLPGGGDGKLALACGPPPMIEHAVLPNLDKMKYDMVNSVIVF
ncbi:unnamed protein product [Urochloa humidicola]